MSLYYRSTEKIQKAWRPVSIADATRYSVPWSRRIQAEDMLIDKIFDHQIQSASCALSRKVKESECKTKPQKAPLYTQYPDYPAARACIGLSAITEFNAHFSMGNILLTPLNNVPENIKRTLDSHALSQTASYVIEAVHRRVCLDHLTIFEEMAVVEAYRLFAVSMLDLRFDRLRDVIFGACILGDLIYALMTRHQISERCHPLTIKILNSLAPACAKYEKSLIDCTPDKLLIYADILAGDLVKALLPFLPEAQIKQPNPFPKQTALEVLYTKTLQNHGRVPTAKQNPVSEANKSTPLRGLDEVLPPSIDQKERLMRAASQDINEDKIPNPNPVPNPDSQTKKLLTMTSEALRQAAGKGHWGDPRVDEVSNQIRSSLFKSGVVEQEINATRRKTLIFGCEREEYIHEKVLPRSGNKQAVEKIIASAAPIEKQLKRFVWFGQREQKALKHYQNRGTLDPRRLHKIGISQLINRRWNDENVIDYQGRPLVVLAKDGSSSNTLKTIFTGQILTAAFLRTRHITKVDMVAADYSSDRTGSLVQWLYHPSKTHCTGLRNFVAPIASLAPKGQGGNKDVESISYILQESLAITKRGQYIHVINITDGKFNSPIPDLRSMIKKLREDNDLTYSFIVLGSFKINIQEADYTISIPENELNEPHSIAERIAKHINLLVRNRRAKRKSVYG